MPLSEQPVGLKNDLVPERAWSGYWWTLLALSLLAGYAYFAQKTSLEIYYARGLQGDLAAIWQSIYNIAFHGNPNSSFNCSVHEYYPLISRADITEPLTNVTGCNQLGVHFHGWIYPLAIVARLYPDPTVLLWIQTLVLTAAGGVLFCLARKRLQSGALAVLILLSYLLNIFIHGLNLNEFHFDAFFPLLIFLAVYFYWERRHYSFLLSVAGILLLKESGAVVVFGLGCCLLVLHIFERRGWKLALLLMVAGPIALFTLTEKIMPPLSFAGHYIFGGIYGCPLGASAGQIITNSILNPGLLWRTLWTVENRQYLTLLFLSTSPLALLRPYYLLIGAPILFVNLVTSNVAMKLTVGQYSGAVLPGFFIATLAVLIAAQRRPPFTKWFIYSAFLCSLACNLYYFYQQSYLLKPVGNQSTFSSEITSLLTIPEEESVCTDTAYVSYLASRPDLYMTPVNISLCSVIVWDKTEPLWYMPPDVREKAKRYRDEHFIPQSDFASMTIYKRK